MAPPDNPLLASGAMRDSIGVKVDGDAAQIGTNDQVAIWQNQGTSARGVPYDKGVSVTPGVTAREFIARSAFRMRKRAAFAVALPVLRLFTDNVPEAPE
jgi:phage gpG-like protein